MRNLFLPLLFILLQPVSAMNNKIDLSWSVGYSASKNETPKKFVHAEVPGAVQLDIARAEKYPPLAFDENYRSFGWMEDNFYTYRTTFSCPELNGQRLFFHSNGIDYQFDLFLNDKLLFSQEGMFTYVDIDLTDHLQKENELKILIYPVPKLHASPADRTQAAHVAKPPVSYGWDWHPRLVPLGIWDDTYLEIRNEAYLIDFFMHYELSDSFDLARLILWIDGNQLTDKYYSWKLTDMTGNEALIAEGKISANKSQVSGLELKNPELWWPHDHGTPYLYTSVLQIKNKEGEILDEEVRKIGFRRVKLVMNEGAWNEPDDFPKTRSVPPAQIEINGHKIFAKGSNWVNPDIFPGRINRERYAELIAMGKNANFNIFRIWGGGIVNKESFFELCDEMGMLVWQEFPLACNNYPDDQHYLSILEQEATSIVRRLRKHPSVAMWCGGNELFNSWSGMTDQSLPLRLLNSICLEYDPHTPYNPTSPLMGMAHGNYIFRYFDGKEVFQAMNDAHFTAYTEFGMPGLSPRSVLEKIIPKQELFPPKPGTAWEAHHAFNAWVGATWLCDDILDFYFGKAKNLDELIEQSQLLQSEGYKAIFEEARRQKPYCSMAINWCYQEPWPTAANNSLIVYPDIPKPAYFAVSDACRPVCGSARLPKFQWKENEYFSADLFILNDKFEKSAGYTLRAKLQCENDTIEILRWDSPALQPNQNIAGPTVRYRLPHWQGDRFKLLIEVDGKPEYNSEYTLLYSPDELKEKKTATMNLD
ncbi:MAG: glycoside hydrolase family 2 TIM barrel-domain containing protein [Bacteroidales bacterium]|nr:glycoside hydrolase family 2 TIM barrel-domain containing protein [Bacteroidales bacterium]